MNTAAIGLSRIRFELVGYFRRPDTVFFTFLFPVLMLGIFGAAFSSMGNVGTRPDGTGGVSMAFYYLPGLVAAGIFLSGVQNLASDIAQEKYDGTLKRLGGTPLPPVSYFIGKIGLTIVTALLQAALIIVFGMLVFGIRLPSDPATWVTFGWLFLLGIATMSLLGIALAALPRSARSAAAVVLPVVIVLQFISGVYLQFSMLPSWLQSVAGVFPLKWLAQGMRSVFLPGHFASAEQSGSWDLGMIALMLAVWFIVGAVATLVTFRWVKRS